MKKDNDLRVRGVVLRRVNFGEVDRILEILTPLGKFSVMAKGVRKERSKLAGGVEMFCLSEMTIHLNKKNKEGMGILTSAKLERFYSGIMQDLNRLDLAGLAMKKVALLAEQVDDLLVFEFLIQVMEGLDLGMNLELVESWFWWNLLKIKGEMLNLGSEVGGERLMDGVKYSWSFEEGGLRRNERGEIDSEMIKLMRLMDNLGLIAIKKVRGVEIYLPRLIELGRSLNA